MSDERNVRLFRNGRNQAVRIPRDLELPGNEATLRREGDTLVIVAKRPRSLLATLRRLQPLRERWPKISDSAPEPVDL